MLPVSLVLLDSLTSEHNSAWGDLLQELMIQFFFSSGKYRLSTLPSRRHTQSQSADSRENNS